jgi:adenine-specific DNA glycosylase
MGLLAGKMFCCAMMICAACSCTAATTRGWQCPVLSTPAWIQNQEDIVFLSYRKSLGA